MKTAPLHVCTCAQYTVHRTEYTAAAAEREEHEELQRENTRRDMIILTFSYAHIMRYRKIDNTIHTMLQDHDAYPCMRCAPGFCDEVIRRQSVRQENFLCRLRSHLAIGLRLQRFAARHLLSQQSRASKREGDDKTGRHAPSGLFRAEYDDVPLLQPLRLSG